MKPHYAALSLIVLGLAGCGTPSSNQDVGALNRKLEREHSPYRYNSIQLPGGASVQLELMPLPNAPTSASPQLKAEIETMLGQAEAKAGRSADVVIKAVKPFETTAKQVTEVWVVDAAGRSFAYVVKWRPYAYSGSDIVVEGPRQVELRPR